MNEQLAKDRYRRLSARYDYATRRIEPVRKLTIDALRLERGQRVLDVACGTGKSFEMLREAVGPEGVVVGVEQSHEMLQQASERVRQDAWDNVQPLPPQCGLEESSARVAKASGFSLHAGVAAAAHERQ